MGKRKTKAEREAEAAAAEEFHEQVAEPEAEVKSGPVGDHECKFVAQIGSSYPRCAVCGASL